MSDLNDNIDLDKIKERIAKLLKMAADASSPNEAAIAAGRARKLMDQYQLAHADINTGSFKEKMVKEGATRAYAAIPQYIVWLAVSIAKYNDCQAVYENAEVTHRAHLKAKLESRTKRWGKRLVFRGYETDVALARDMLERLCDANDSACRVHMKAEGFTRYDVKVGGHFKEAFALAVGSRLRELSKERESLTNEASGTALVVVKTGEVDAHFGKVKYGSSRYEVDYNHASAARAKNAGTLAGKAARIHEGVESSRKAIEN